MCRYKNEGSPWRFWDTGRWWEVGYNRTFFRVGDWRVSPAPWKHFFFFFNFFDVHCFLKSLLNLLHYCFCGFFFNVFLGLGPQSIWDLSSPTKDQTRTPWLPGKSLLGNISENGNNWCHAPMVTYCLDWKLLRWWGENGHSILEMKS